MLQIKPKIFSCPKERKSLEWYNRNFKWPQIYNSTSNFSNSEGLSTIIIMLMSAIGGSMIPVFIMPEFMQKIAVLSVNYWGIQGFFDIFWRKLPLIDILPKMFVLFLIGFIMTIISIKLFRRNILKIV